MSALVSMRIDYYYYHYYFLSEEKRHAVGKVAQCKLLAILIIILFKNGFFRLTCSPLVYNIYQVASAVDWGWKNKKNVSVVCCNNNVMYLFSYKVSFYAKPKKLSRHALATFFVGSFTWCVVTNQVAKFFHIIVVIINITAMEKRIRRRCPQHP